MKKKQKNKNSLIQSCVHPYLPISLSLEKEKELREKN